MVMVILYICLYTTQENILPEFINVEDWVYWESFKILRVVVWARESGVKMRKRKKRGTQGLFITSPLSIIHERSQCDIPPFAESSDMEDFQVASNNKWEINGREMITTNL